jgi:hypothetical protein
MSTTFDSESFQITLYVGSALLGEDRQRAEICHGESYFHELTIIQLRELRDLLNNAIKQGE